MDMLEHVKTMTKDQSMRTMIDLTTHVSPETFLKLVSLAARIPGSPVMRAYVNHVKEHLQRGEDDQGDALKDLAASSYYVQDYLIEEVLSYVPPAVARSLLETSLLERFCAPLCDVFRTVHDTQDNAEEALSGQMFIEWLEKSHLFVIPLDETHHWFRYHHLFFSGGRRTQSGVSPSDPRTDPPYPSLDSR
jgi:hypothetical protein